MFKKKFLNEKLNIIQDSGGSVLGISFFLNLAKLQSTIKYLHKELCQSSSYHWNLVEDVWSHFKQPHSLIHKICSVCQVTSASHGGGRQFVDGNWHSALTYFLSVESSWGGNPDPGDNRCRGTLLPIHPSE